MILLFRILKIITKYKYSLEKGKDLLVFFHLIDGKEVKTVQ